MSINELFQFTVNICTALSNVWVCGHLLAGVVGSSPAGGMDVCSLVSVVCCQVEVSATSLSLIQSSSTDCGASSCVI